MNKITLAACDYLVVGAGAAGLAFTDTLLQLQPKAIVLLIDKHQNPGGHWNDAYGHVHLHQPSLLYGVQSRQLEGSWLNLAFRGILPWQHRASRQEILEHYRKLVQDWQDSGRAHFYGQCRYDFQASANGIHSFKTLDEKTEYQVTVNKKLVNAVAGECVVPSMHPPAFPISDGIKVITPNQLYNDNQTKQGWWYLLQKPSTEKYVVMGNGKTAMDAIVYLRRDMKIPAKDIQWIISRDVWMIKRDGGGTPWSLGQAQLELRGSIQEAALALEKRGIVARLDSEIEPSRFSFSVIGNDELSYCRSVKQTYRHGRITSLQIQNGEVAARFQNGSTVSFAEDTTFVHCTSPGPFNSNNIEDIFVTDDRLDLFVLFAPPVPISYSCLGAMESAIQNGTTNFQLGRRLLTARGVNGDDLSDNDVIRALMKGNNFTSERQTDTNISLALFVALFDKDVRTGLEFMKRNRLSFLSVPGFKGRIYESIALICKHGTELGYSEIELSMYQVLCSYLRQIEGM